jgi:hypothetical protein
MRDPVGRSRRQLRRIAAPDQVVPGVQTQRDAGFGEHALHLLRPFHRRSDVRVQCGAQPMVGRDRRGSVQVGQHGPPTGRADLDLLVVADLAKVRSKHQHTDTRRSELGSDPGQRPLRIGVRIVQNDRDEPADHPQPIPIEKCGSLVGTGRQESGRAQLGRGQAERSHFGQHPMDGHLMAPARDLADSPRDRRGDGPVAQRGRAADDRPGVQIRPAAHSSSATRTGRCSARERSAASLTCRAASASAPEQGHSIRPWE